MFYEVPDSPGLQRELATYRKRAGRAAIAVGALGMAISFAGLALTGEACTPAMRRDVATVSVDVATVSVDVARCVLEHLDLDPHGIALVCGVAALRDPAVIRLIASHQMALDRARTSACVDMTPRGRP